MNTPQQRLETIRRELRSEVQADVAVLARDLDDKGEDTTPSQHPADVASDLYAREELVVAEATLRSELRDVEDALARIAHGTYGRCVDCGGSIVPERLEVLPAAARCITCQRAADHYRPLR
ncbi:MAG TPA: TraR/DksA C4-type zinc finger protein [Candidatus Acidoferrales bacterium]|nr:TraR/DksA C4-type zinc finger protein [Candidatus Acidoferrales bacterium]